MTVSLTLRLDDELHEQLVLRAQQEDRALAQLLRHAARQYLGETLDPPQVGGPPAQHGDPLLEGCALDQRAVLEPYRDLLSPVDIIPAGTTVLFPDLDGGALAAWQLWSNDSDCDAAELRCGSMVMTIWRRQPAAVVDPILGPQGVIRLEHDDDEHRVGRALANCRGSDVWSFTWAEIWRWNAAADGWVSPRGTVRTVPLDGGVLAARIHHPVYGVRRG